MSPVLGGRTDDIWPVKQKNWLKCHLRPVKPAEKLAEKASQIGKLAEKPQLSSTVGHVIQPTVVGYVALASMKKKGNVTPAPSFIER